MLTFLVALCSLNESECNETSRFGVLQVFLRFRELLSDA